MMNHYYDKSTIYYSLSGSGYFFSYSSKNYNNLDNKLYGYLINYQSFLLIIKSLIFPIRFLVTYT